MGSDPRDITGSRPVDELNSASGSPRDVAPRRYVLISPCRDEGAYLRRTLDTVAAQSVPPALWIVVDDGSTDETPQILEEYAARLPYLRVVRRQDRGHRRVGPGVIEAFYDGLDQVPLGDFGYLCKLDMDLVLPPRYFELLMQRMEGNPRIGTTSGKPWRWSSTSGLQSGSRRSSSPKCLRMAIFTPRPNTASICWRSCRSGRSRPRWRRRDCYGNDLKPGCHGERSEV